MAIKLNFDSADEAFRVFRLAAQDEEFSEALFAGFIDEYLDIDYWDQIEDFTFGAWITHEVKVLEDLHSEINGPFLDAYVKINDDLQRLYAYVKYGNADIRNLTQEDLDYFQLKVKVVEGSSEFWDNIKELVEKLGKETISKMSGKEAVIMVVGLALVTSGYFGTSGYLEGRKEIRLEELRSEERRGALKSMEFASKEQSERFEQVVNIMQTNSEASNRALDAALSVQSELLRAASKTGPVIIADNHLNRTESKELAQSKRRSSQQKIIEQEFKIVGGNTADPSHTQIILEDKFSGKQIKVSFRDRAISDQKRATVFAALEKRASSWFRLSVKEVEGEIVSAEIIDVVQPPDPPATGGLRRLPPPRSIR